MVTMFFSSVSEGRCPRDRITMPSSVAVIRPSRSLSKSIKASLNSATCSSESPYSALERKKIKQNLKVKHSRTLAVVRAAKGHGKLAALIWLISLWLCLLCLFFQHFCCLAAITTQSQHCHLQIEAAVACKLNSAYRRSGWMNGNHQREEHNKITFCFLVILSGDDDKTSTHVLQTAFFGNKKGTKSVRHLLFCFFDWMTASAGSGGRGYHTRRYWFAIMRHSKRKEKEQQKEETFHICLEHTFKYSAHLWSRTAVFLVLRTVRQ